MKRPIIIILSILVIAIIVQDFLQTKKANKQVQPTNYVIMLSLDGFRHDYVTRVNTPTFDSIKTYGSYAQSMQPAFPSVTFPNHYTIATGLHPGNHGIIANSFYNKKLNLFYSTNNKSAVGNGAFYKGEPIWVTAESQKVTAASLYWVGSEAKIKGFRPTYWKPYNHYLPYTQRIDTIIAWLNLPYSKRPKLITWYIDEPDGIGHNYGPESPQIDSFTIAADSLIKHFISKVNKLPLADSVNFIFVSDHGMAAISPNKVVKLSGHLNKNWVDTVYNSSPFALVCPAKNCTDSVFNSLKNVDGITVYKKSSLPDRFYYKQNNNVTDIVLLANAGYSFTFGIDTLKFTGGTHGYDNTNPQMHGIFYAIGPNFKQGQNVGQIQNVDIYNLICRLLNVKPAQNNGDTTLIFRALKSN